MSDRELQSPPVNDHPFCEDISQGAANLPLRAQSYAPDQETTLLTPFHPLQKLLISDLGQDVLSFVFR